MTLLLSFGPRADPCGERDRLDKRDPVTASLAALLDAGYTAIGPRHVTTADLIRATDSRGNAELRAALIEFAGDNRGGINAKSLGQTLRAFENRIIDGCSLVCYGTRKNVVLWGIKREPTPGQRIR